MRKRQKYGKGSLTVETILVLPPCLMALILFMSFFHVLQLQIQLQNALDQTLQQQALIAGAKEDGQTSYLAAEGEFLLLCESTNVDFDRIEWGPAGLHLLLTKEDSVLQGTLLYRIRLPFLTGLGGRLLCVQQGQSRIWTGVGYEDSPPCTEYFYYTEYGTVYHRYLDCTYLKLSIHPVTAQELPAARNRNGGKYYPCELCGDEQAGDRFYITEQGDRYHTRLDCSSLTRYIKTIPAEDISQSGLGECSRCAKRRGREELQ